MKNLNKIFIILLLGATTVSCEKDKETADVSSTTEYPIFEMEGEKDIFIERGTAFTDPGVIATEGGANLDVSISVKGIYTGNTTFDPEVSDIYEFTYSATNKDGFSGSTTRNVYVVETGDLINSISGLYTSTIIRNDIPKFQNLKYVFISDNNNDDTYEIQDGIGMYYAIGTNYGLAYSAPTTVTAIDIATNSFAYSEPFGVGAFGGEAVMSSMVVDPDSHIVEYTTVWVAPSGTVFTFEVTLTQIQF